MIMSLKSFPLFLALVFVSLISPAQEPCGHDTYIQSLEEQYPGFLNAYEDRHLEAIEHIYQKKVHKYQATDTIFRIPVVFHIVYNNIVENLNDSLIYSQIDVLNASFRRRNSDTVNTREIFKPVAADTRIEFYLATEDPSGNPTSGITRTSTSKTTFYSLNYADEMKFTATGGKDAWDPTTYLNIWVCDISSNGLDVLLGYAFPPVDAAFWGSESFVSVARQGVVLHYKIVGVGNPLMAAIGATAEKTAVHEVGHYLGLRHIWGDGSSFNGCNVDDGIFDTPNARLRHQGCNLGINTCGAGMSGDLPDQAENYMDYSNGSCTNMFTREQTNLMRYNLEYLRNTVPVKSIVYNPPPEVFINAVYPNPSNGFITIELGNPVSDMVYKCVFTDLLGRPVHIYKNRMQNKNSFDVQGLAPGLYYLELYDENNKKLMTEKIVRSEK